MEKFNPASRCPKCDNDVATSTYYPGYQEDDRWTRLSEAGAGEYIERECQLCGYRWAQAVLNKTKQQKEVQNG